MTVATESQGSIISFNPNGNFTFFLEEKLLKFFSYLMALFWIRYRFFLLQTLTSFRREQHFSVLDCTAQLCPGGETDRSWRESPEPKPNRKFSEPKPKRETTQRFSHGRSTARDGKTCGPIAQTVNQYSNVSQPTKKI